MGNNVLFEVLTVPDKEFDKRIIFDIIGGNCFELIYDFETKTTLLSMPEAKSRPLMLAIPGLTLKEAMGRLRGKELLSVSAYRKPDMVEKYIFSDMFDLDIDNGSLTITFEPLDMSGVKEAKSYIEKILSLKDARETTSVVSDVLSRRVNRSLQRENFTNSEEVMLFTEILESINRSILRNGFAYKVHFVIDDGSGKLADYIKSRFLVIAESPVRGIEEVQKLKAFPLGIETASNLLNFRGNYDLGYTIPTAYARSGGDVAVGTVMKSSILDTGKGLSIDASTLNLGSMFSGLPGTGKTMEAMAIIDALAASNKKPCIAIISPTDEWNRFAESHGMRLVKLFDGKTPINFFRCPDGADPEKFYSDLSMIISSASRAGPFRNPMEKCMLNAFRNVYSNTTKPAPSAVYKEIEEAIVRFHGRRAKSGAVKYTKHGENIMSSLENLRAILAKPEYASMDGEKFEELAEAGVVFDISNVGAGSKPYIYALILNQLYSVASGFDTHGDSELRLLLCLEEAQMIFRDKDAAAVQDLQFRIQDFRKRGIGLMLLTHNVTDIEASIRRLCQTKLYLKQAPDVAAIAAKDLVFTYAEEEDVIKRLKHLDSRVGALSYVLKDGSNKISQDTVFIRTKEYGTL